MRSHGGAHFCADEHSGLGACKYIGPFLPLQMTGDDCVLAGHSEL